MSGPPCEHAAMVRHRIVRQRAGTITPGGEPFYLTIAPGGTLTASWGANWTWGTVTLYESGGGRRLVLDDDWSRG